MLQITGQEPTLEPQELSDKGAQEGVEPEECHKAMDTLVEDMGVEPKVVEPKVVEHKVHGQEKVKALPMQL